MANKIDNFLLKNSRILYRQSSKKDVVMFYKKNIYPKEYLTFPIKHNFPYSLITSNDFYTTETILEEHKDLVAEKTPYYMARYISENLRMPLVVFIKSYCEAFEKQEYFEIHYVNQKQKSLEDFKILLEEIQN